MHEETVIEPNSIAGSWKAAFWLWCLVGEVMVYSQWLLTNNCLSRLYLTEHVLLAQSSLHILKIFSVHGVA